MKSALEPAGIISEDAHETRSESSGSSESVDQTEILNAKNVLNGLAYDYGFDGDTKYLLSEGIKELVRFHDLQSASAVVTPLHIKKDPSIKQYDGQLMDANLKIQLGQYKASSEQNKNKQLMDLVHWLASKYDVGEEAKESSSRIDGAYTGELLIADSGLIIQRLEDNEFRMFALKYLDLKIQQQFLMFVLTQKCYHQN